MQQSSGDPQCIVSRSVIRGVAFVIFWVGFSLATLAGQPEQNPVGRSISGVYPHLRMWNEESECGTGAVVVWQSDLWVVTYAPHAPAGSSDKLYQITPQLQQQIFAGSVGGTPANRLIHTESSQLLIGPYVIDSEKSVRVIPPAKMFGRLTGNARHLTAPADKVYYATMEEGLYEVDVRTLDVTCLIRDGNPGAPPGGIVSDLPGYHGKGLYSTQGRLLYANNGERGPEVKTDPTVASGALAEWSGQGDWNLVRRNQFTEVSGPGGIFGNPHPETDPVWSLGWDQKSLLLALLQDGQWHFYRLPKASHSYDGAHGWNTEWPRIRDIGEDDLLATMHGTFWQFPSTFSLQNSAGIRPRSNYLKVIGDFCRWNDQIVLGCDDSARAEFLNTRPFKAEHGSPRQSNSNLWFIEPQQLDQLGPVIGRGSVWLRESVSAGQISDPYLFSGYDFRQLHLSHDSEHSVSLTLEVDKAGSNHWQPLQTVTVPAGAAVSQVFPADVRGAWIRIAAQTEAWGLTAHFQYRNRDSRPPSNADLFSGIATTDQPAEVTGVMRSLAHDRLGLVAADAAGGLAGYYEMNSDLQLVRIDDPAAAQALVTAVRQPADTFTEDAASVLLVEDGQRFRLPKSEQYAGQQESRSRGSATVQQKALTDYLQQNLARTADVTVSSTHQQYQAKYAVDGRVDDDQARWISNNDEPGWIELDLGRETSFRSLWVVSGWQFDPQYAVRDFDVQIDDGRTWQTLPQGTVRGNQQVQREIRFAESVTTRRLRIAAVNPGFLRLYEIALFADPLDLGNLVADDFGPARVCREVATERDLLNVHGTFYELPARNAEGLAKVRPIATHNLAVQDFCSHNGLLFLAGLDRNSSGEHILRSPDGRAAVWAGVIDDLWQLGKPTGHGGPWKDSAVTAGEPSDPYLMTAYDQKSVELVCNRAARIQLQVDIDGTGLWIPYQSFDLTADQPVIHEFPEGFSAYWVRAVCDTSAQATVMFTYR